MSNYVTCSKCKKAQSALMFCKDATKTTGRHPHCSVCRSAQAKVYYKNNKQLILSNNKIWHETNKEYHNAQNKINDNKRKVLNPLFWKPYYEDHKAEYTARSAKRRAIKLKATSSWANLVRIKEYYISAKYLQLEVDHIVPLQHPLVCGLHNEHNLQLLPRELNRSKGNSFEVGEQCYQ